MISSALWMRGWVSWACFVFYFIVPLPYAGYLAACLVLVGSLFSLDDAIAQKGWGGKIITVLYIVIRAALFVWILALMQSHANALASVGPIHGHLFTGEIIQRHMVGATLAGLGWVINRSLLISPISYDLPALLLKRGLHLATVSALGLFISMIPGMYVVGVVAVVLMAGSYLADFCIHYRDERLAEAENA